MQNTGQIPARSTLTRPSTSRASGPRPGSFASGDIRYWKSGPGTVRADGLSFDDLIHCQKIVVALTETVRLMEEIGAAIPSVAYRVTRDNATIRCKEIL